MSKQIQIRRKPIPMEMVTNIPKEKPFVPSFHILIATGGKTCLQHMLQSLKKELWEQDAITIVFDGEDAKRKSGFLDKWIEGFRCSIHVIEQVPNLGYWGHGIRNQYQSQLQTKTTFIMHADDDDEYAPGCFDQLRIICKNKDTLYIARFWVKKKNILVPSQQMVIQQDDIGTPCGIIPFDIASQSTWELRYGGDFNYYDNLQKFVKNKQFLQLIIYHVL
jgi:hypothetical protein